MLNRFFQSLFRSTVHEPQSFHSKQLIQIGPSRSSEIVIGPSTTIIVRPSIPVLIQPPPRGAWQEKGWIMEHHAGSETYRGQYVTIDRALRQHQQFAGRLETLHREIRAFIADPPSGIRTHPKGPCFSLIGEGWYQIHWHRAPKNVDDAILYIERILDEVVNRRYL
jgi:hypothetical protein